MSVFLTNALVTIPLQQIFVKKLSLILSFIDCLFEFLFVQLSWDVKG